MLQDITNKANEIDPEIDQRALNITRQAYRLCSVMYRTRRRKVVQSARQIGASFLRSTGQSQSAGQIGAATVAALRGSSSAKRREKKAGVSAAMPSPSRR